MPAPGGTYNRDAITQPVECPTWQATGVAESLRYGFGLVLDTLNEGYRQGMLAHMPGLGDPSALPILGNDRLIQQGFDETNAAYALRLQQAPDTWATAGSAWSVLANVLGFVSPSGPVVRTVTNLGTWDSMNDPAAPVTGTPTWRVPLGGNWRWDSVSDPAWYVVANARAWIIIYSISGSPWSSAVPVCGTGIKCGSGALCGWAGTKGQASELSKLAAIWKQAGCVVPWIIVTYDATWFVPTVGFPSAKQPDGHWGHWGKIVSGVYVAARPTTGMSFIDGARS